MAAYTGPTFGSIEIKPSIAPCTIMISPNKNQKTNVRNGAQASHSSVFSGSLICIVQLVILKKIMQYRGCLSMPILRSFYFQVITLISLKLYLFIYCIYFWDGKYWFIYCKFWELTFSDVHGISFTVIKISISPHSFYYFVIIEHSMYIYIEYIASYSYLNL